MHMAHAHANLFREARDLEEDEGLETLEHKSKLLGAGFIPNSKSYMPNGVYTMKTELKVIQMARHGGPRHPGQRILQ